MALKRPICLNNYAQFFFLFLSLSLHTSMSFIFFFLLSVYKCYIFFNRVMSWISRLMCACNRFNSVYGTLRFLFIVSLNHKISMNDVHIHLLLFSSLLLLHSSTIKTNLVIWFLSKCHTYITSDQSDPSTWNSNIFFISEFRAYSLFRMIEKKRRKLCQL